MNFFFLRSILVVGFINLEIVLPAPKCSEEQYQCSDLKCIPKEWVCDGDADCADFSDEQNCSKTFCHPLKEFRCGNGKCLPKSWKCDQQIDCSFNKVDQSDEQNCEVKKCLPSQFQCKKSEKCIPKTWQCDNDMDCQDGSDETNCIAKCNEGEFTCRNGRCIDQLWRCDRENDCGDHTDEEGCAQGNTNCSVRHFQCSNKFCIPSHWVCDGDHDCRDGSDEKALVCKMRPRSECGSYHFQCRSSTSNIFTSCIIMDWRCDGVRDCIDGSDEENCNAECEHSQSNCSSNPLENSNNQAHNGLKDCSDKHFKCNISTDECIDQSLECDGKTDCSNGADEHENCNINECKEKKHHCSQKCIDLTDGYKCACHQGFYLQKNGFTCQDIDECQTLGRCSQQCVNTKGSFKCICASGYQLVNNTGCKVRGDKMFFLFPERSTIRILKIQKTLHLHSVIADLNGAVGLTYYANDGLLYWSDMKEKSISRIPIFGSNRRESLVVSGLGSTEGLAVDWLAKNLYWVDSKKHIIEAANLTGYHRTTLTWTGENKPRNLVVDPRERHRLLYFSSWGDAAQIERISMDGENTTKIIFYQSEGSWPNCLCLDFELDSLFWIDPKRSTIEVVTLHAPMLNHRIVHKTRENHPYGLAVFEDFAYWTDWLTGAIHRVNKFTGLKDERMIEYLYRPMGIAAYHNMLQPAAPNPCARAKCSHLCFLSKNHGHQCACADGVELMDNGITCNVNDSSICHDGFCHSGECEAKIVNQRWKPHCKCDAGFVGERCDKAEELLKPIYNSNGKIVRYGCLPGYCKNEGVCIESKNNESFYRPICRCRRNFYGERCTYYTNLFDSDAQKQKQRKAIEDDERTKGTIIGFGVGVVSACGAFAAMAYYLQRKSSTRVYINPRYRGTSSSEEDTQLQTMPNDEMNSETST